MFLTHAEAPLQEPGTLGPTLKEVIHTSCTKLVQVYMSLIYDFSIAALICFNACVFWQIHVAFGVVDSGKLAT